MPAASAIFGYQYDTAGDLVAFYDRLASVEMTDPVQFVYSQDRPHFLEEIIDPLGRVAAQTEYDATGRRSSTATIPSRWSSIPADSRDLQRV